MRCVSVVTTWVCPIVEREEGDGYKGECHGCTAIGKESKSESLCRSE